MKNFILKIIFGLAISFLLNTISTAQEVDPFIQEQVDQLQYDSLYSKLQTFENLGIKQTGTSAIDATVGWLIQQHQQFGYTDIKIDTFMLGSNEVYNIIVTKTGTVYPDTYLIIDGHYDTYNGPGVNDNGSGTAIVLELARMMAGVETEYSIKFIHFTAEEMGLIGSTHYVENTVIPQNMDIRLVFNIDEVGGVAGMVNNTITCERDEWTPVGNNEASAAFTDTLAYLTEMYSILNTSISYAYGSDYVPFMSNGYVVTGLYEYNESPYPHSINDSLSNMDPEYVFEITKASLAATLYFSNYLNNSTAISLTKAIRYNITIGPNPFDEFLEIDNRNDRPLHISIFDLTGRLFFFFAIEGHNKNSLTPKLLPDVYLIRFSTVDGEYLFSKKIIKR